METTQIQALSDEAAAAGDLAMVAICTRALNADPEFASQLHDATDNGWDIGYELGRVQGMTQFEAVAECERVILDGQG